MSYLQVTAFRPSLRVHIQYNKPHGFAPLNLHDALKPSIGSSKKFKELMKCYVIQRNGYQRCTPVCLFGGKGESKNDNEDSSWKSMEKAMSSFKKEQSLEDMLRQQMEKQEYFGGSGGGIGGGGGGDGDGFGGTEDGDIFDDILQVTFAIVALIVLYLYIIAGDQVMLFVTDAFDFILGKKGPRLRTIMYDFARFYQAFRAKVPYDQYWLEKAIILTPTLYDSPKKYQRMLKRSIKGEKMDSDSDNDKYDNDKSYGEDSDDDDENSYNSNNYGNKAYNDTYENENENGYYSEDEF